MIGLLAGLALADPCAREVVVGRGLTVTPPDGAVAEAAVDVRLVLRSRQIDGIPTFYVRHVRLDWSWTLTVPGAAVANAAVGLGDALCEGEVVNDLTWVLSAGPSRLDHRVDARRIDACRVRVVLKGTLPEAPLVTLEVVGARPPGPDAPVTGPRTLTPGGDLVIDVPACL